MLLYYFFHTIVCGMQKEEFLPQARCCGISHLYPLKKQRKGKEIKKGRMKGGGGKQKERKKEKNNKRERTSNQFASNNLFL